MHPPLSIFAVIQILCRKLIQSTNQTDFQFVKFN